MVRASQSAYEFLNEIYSAGDADEALSDQDAMQKCFKYIFHNASRVSKEHDNSVSGKNTVVIPQTWMNAFPQEIRCYDDYQRPWERGMFNLHFAGAWAHMSGVDDAYGVSIIHFSFEAIAVLTTLGLDATLCRTSCARIDYVP